MTSKACSVRAESWSDRQVSEKTGPAAAKYREEAAMRWQSQKPPVRTTVLLPHDIWLDGKNRAAQERTSLQDLFIRGLRLVCATELGGTEQEEARLG